MRFATAADQLGASNPFYRPVVNEGTFWGFLESLNVRREGNQKDHRLFRALFGCPPLVCVDLWETCSFPQGTAPKHMMWALLFLKVYATEDVLCSILRCCRKTFRKWLWPTVLAIAKAKPIVVSWELRAHYLSFWMSCCNVSSHITLVRPFFCLLPDPIWRQVQA